MIEVKLTFATAAAAAAALAKMADGAAPQPEAAAPAPKPKPPAAAAAAPKPAPAAPAFEYSVLQKQVYALAAKDRAAVGEIAKAFGVTSFKELAAERWEEAHKAVTAKLAELETADAVA